MRNEDRVEIKRLSIRRPAQSSVLIPRYFYSRTYSIGLISSTEPLYFNRI